MLGPDNAFWDDGEWISWEDINRQIQYKEWRAKYPNGDLALVPVFENLLGTAQQYNEITGNHLDVYGCLGELFGAIRYGFKLNRNYAEGSDGRMGNDFVEVKTITPFKGKDVVEVNKERNFNKLLIVRINNNFEISHRLIDRNSLPDRPGKKLRIRWADY